MQSFRLVLIICLGLLLNAGVVQAADNAANADSSDKAAADKAAAQKAAADKAAQDAAFARYQEHKKAGEEAQAQAAAETLKLLALQDALSARPRESLTAAELLDYQQQALLCLKLGLVAMSAQNYSQPWAIGPQDSGWVCQWPANPYDLDASGKWRPIEVLSVHDPFKPGALVWQTPPAEAFTIQDGWPSCLGFELSLYGATPDAQATGLVAPQAGNASWAVVPPDSVAMLGLAVPPYGELPASITDPALVLQQIQREAVARPLAREYYREHFADLTPGANFRYAWFVQQLGGTLEYQQQMQQYEAVLQAEPREQWTEEQQLDYLQYAGWMVYNSIISTANAGRDEVTDIESLKASALLPQWPDNPYDNWRPMKVLSAGAGFSAGDLCLQSAPLEFSSHINTSLGHNFVLSVYGPRPDYAPANLSPVMDKQQAWAISPPGSAGNYSAFSSEVLDLAFNRARMHPDLDNAQMQWPDGSPRRLLRSISSAELDFAAKQLSQASDSERPRALALYQRSVLQGLYIAIEEYKYEHGSLPADLTQLGGSDYLDSWPGDPLGALESGAGLLITAGWPALKVLGPKDEPQPGCLVYAPGQAGGAQWVRDSLAGPFAKPALAYTISLYGRDVSAGPVATIQAAAETWPETECRRAGHGDQAALLHYEAVHTQYAPERVFWPAAPPREAILDELAKLKPVEQ